MNESLKHAIVDRLSEGSTWRGLIMLITSFGVHLSPDTAESIVSLGMAAAGMIGVIIKEKN